MKKVLDFLENNVQWVALGLGVAFVLWMAYSYLLSSDHVAVTIGNEKLSPGEVDRYIVDNGVTELQTRINDPNVRQTMSSPSWAQAFADELKNRGDAAVALAPIFPVNQIEKPGQVTILQMRDIIVEKLPTAPAAVVVDARSGRSTVAMPNQLAQVPPPADGQAEARVQPVMDDDPDKHDDAAIPAAAQNGVDKLWITFTYRIPMGEMNKSFSDVGVPMNANATTVLAVEVYRQEMQPNGEWGPETRIGTIPTVQILPLPHEKASVAQKQAFLDWANKNTVALLQPPFYTVLAGDAWAPPGQQAAPVVQEQPQQDQKPFNPADFVNAPHDELMKLTPEQRRQVYEYKQKLKEDEQKNRNKGGRGGKGGGSGGRGVGGGGGMGGGPLGPDDGGRGPGGDQGGYIDPGTFEGGPRETPQGREQMPPPPIDEQRLPEEAQAPNFADFPIPDGEFNPGTIPDAVCWAHDDTVEANKTYRYRVVYHIKNPVWNMQNVTKPAELAQTFNIRSVEGEWGEPISMESLTKFFVLRQSFRGDSATVEVFRWHGGKLQRKQFDVAPGDAVGVPDNGIDFSTGWTLVDMRRDGRTQETNVVLMDPSGKLHTRDVRSDANSPEYKQMTAEATAASGAPADSVAGANGR